MTFDLGWPWRVKINKLTHISGMVKDRVMISIGNIHKVTWERSNEVMTFDTGWPWMVKIKKMAIPGMVRDRATYKVTYELSNEDMTFDLGWPWRVKINKLTHISGMVKDRAINAMGNIHKLTHKLLNQVMTFDDSERLNSTNWLSREWWEIGPWTQWATHAVTCELSNEVMTFDFQWPWRVKIHKLTHIMGLVRDKAMDSLSKQPLSIMSPTAVLHITWQIFP